MTKPLRRIGGTDISRIIGASPYGGPIDAWRRIVEGYSPPENDAMRRGLRLEPVVRQLYLDETGARLREHPGVVLSPQHAFMAASVDDMAVRDGSEVVCEYKTAGIRAARDWGTQGDEVPLAYLTQVAWYLAATDLHAADLAVLIGVDDFRVFRIIRDMELESMLVERAESFWVDYCLSGKPPPPDASDSYMEWLQRRYPESRGLTVEATPEIDAIAKLLKAAREEQDEAEARVKEYRNNIIAFMGDADVITGPFGRISYKSTKSSAKTDWEALARELNPPVELVQKHTAIKPGGRRFLPTFTGAKES